MKFLLFSASYSLYLTGDFLYNLFHVWNAPPHFTNIYKYIMSLSLHIDNTHNLGVWDICS